MRTGKRLRPVWSTDALSSLAGIAVGVGVPEGMGITFP
jgi:hypothetical protein